MATLGGGGRTSTFIKHAMIVITLMMIAHRLAEVHVQCIIHNMYSVHVYTPNTKYTQIMSYVCP
jgi:hypothetical protein